MSRILLGVMLAACVSQATIIYVVNSLDESLGWANLENNQYEAQAVTLGAIPNDVIATEENLFVVNSGLNTLQVIDRISLTTLDEIELVSTVNPWAAAVIDDERVVITGLLSGTVSIVNILTRSVDTTWVTGVSPQDVRVYNGALYVLNTGVSFPNFNNGVLKKYSVESYALMDSVVLGINPQSMEFFQDELHVVCTGNYSDIVGTLQVVTLASMTLDTTITLGGSPGSLSIAGTNGLIAAGGWGSEGYVFLYDTESLDILRGSINPILTGVGATDVSAVSELNFVVSCFGDANLELREIGGSLVQTFPMSAGAGPLGVWHGSGQPADPKLPVAGEFNFLEAYPNPFNGSVSIEWSTISHVAGFLQIQDVLGREVSSIPVPAGQQRTLWNPVNSSRREVAAGVYFARLVSHNSAQPVRLLYIK